MKMHTVTYHLWSGERHTVPVPDGLSLLEAALAHDVELEHACGGFCACTTCHVLVESGADSLSPMSFDEEDRLDTAEGVTLRSRLACQSRVLGDVTVRVPKKPY